MKNLQKIDINFDFTIGIPGYWDDFWADDCGIGGGKGDPDIKSKTLRRYHQLLWSRQLPNGEFMNLKMGTGRNYLIWKDFCFGSDSITASFRYQRYRTMLRQVSDALPNYRLFMESFIKKSYTIGGTIIFPKRRGNINQSRGCNNHIKDRWDLTLDCIRKYYNNEKSPLYEVLQKDKDFFDLFLNFKGYIDYFFLQDCVAPDYKTVHFWIAAESPHRTPLPQTVEEYLQWISQQINFIEKRNARIQAFCSCNKSSLNPGQTGIV